VRRLLVGFLTRLLGVLAVLAGVVLIGYPAYIVVAGSLFYSVLVVCKGLAKAVRSESAQAVAYWRGVHRQTVWAWRKALGVGALDTGGGRTGANAVPQRGGPPHRPRWS
jgi:hypothetical protein